jgi:membrane protein DedA with SNARE-associated domain
MSTGLSQIAVDMIGALGYGGLAAGLFIDSFGIPIPSEILVPLGAVLAGQGRFTYWAVFVIGTGAQVLGGLLGYVIGRYGGEPFLEKYGKYVLITKRDLERTHKAFAKYGNWLTMVGRCVPGIRGLIAYPAGIAEMKISTFLIFTTLGSAVWTALLMCLGWGIGDRLETLDQLAGKFSLLGILLIIGVVAWHYRHLIIRFGRRDG